MARRGRRRHGRHGFKIPILSLAILAGQAWYASDVLANGGNLLQKASAFASLYTGFVPGGNPAIQPANLLVGYGPWLVKGIVMKVARPLGAAPKMPLKMPISFT